MSTNNLSSTAGRLTPVSSSQWAPSIGFHSPNPSLSIDSEYEAQFDDWSAFFLADDDLSDDSTWFEIGANELQVQTDLPPPVSVDAIEFSIDDIEDDLANQPDIGLGGVVPTGPPQQPYDFDPTDLLGDDDLGDESVWFDTGANEQVTQAPAPPQPQDFDWTPLLGDDDVSAGDEAIFFDQGSEQVVQAPTPQQPRDFQQRDLLGDDDVGDDSVWFEIGANEQTEEAPTPQQPQDFDPTTLLGDDDVSAGDEAIFFDQGNERVQQAPTPQQPYDLDPTILFLGDDASSDEFAVVDIGASNAVGPNFVPLVQPPYSDDPAYLLGDDDQADESVWFLVGANDQIPQAPTPPQPIDHDFSFQLVDDDLGDDSIFFDIGANDQIPVSPHFGFKVGLTDSAPFGIALEDEAVVGAGTADAPNFNVSTDDI